jgi:hypothetical protein
MIYNELKTVFRVYDNIAKQNRFLKPGTVDEVFQMLTPKDGPLPWQFRVPVPEDNGDFSFTAWKIINASTDTEAHDLTELVGEIDHRRSADGYDYFFHSGGTLTLGSGTLNMAAGYYYLQFEVNGATYFSEVFSVVACMNWTDPDYPYLLLVFDNGDSCDLPPILYQTGWQQKLFLDTAIERETPTVEEEGTEDGAKNFVPTLQKFVDNLRFEALVPFTVGEGLVLMSMHRRVMLTTPGGVYNGEIRNIRPSMAQQQNGNIYLVSLEFQQDTQYLNTSCCNLINLSGQYGY